MSARGVDLSRHFGCREVARFFVESTLDRAFVVTVVDGAADAWLADESAMLEALAAHDRIVREIASCHGGVEVRRAGADGFLLAFPRLDAAVAFSIEARIALRSVAWPGEGPADRVAFGVDAGLVSQADPDPRSYVGAAVSRATQLAVLARSGTIVLSSERFEELTRERPDVGEAVVPARRRPSSSDALIGRVPELAALDRAFGEGARIVTLLGPGGVGKTALARAHWQREAPAYRLDGGDAWFVDLTAARSAQDVVRAVAAALGVMLHAGDDVASAAARLSGALARRAPALLVLDNLEQVRDEAAPLIAAWSNDAGDTRMLATSRERLTSTDVCIDVRPLSEADAVNLFLRRSLATGASIDRDADGDSIRAIVGALDCMPLAIELAASRARVLPPRVLAERLKGGLHVLVEPTRPPRHRSTEAVVGWSWGLLSAELQQALAACSVFVGTFTVEAAGAVLESPDRVIDVLSELVDRSLIVVEDSGAPDPQYRLYAIIRTFAAVRLSAAGSLESVRSRCARYFASAVERWAEAACGEEEATYLARVAGSLDNLESAFDYAYAHEPGLAVRIALALDEVLYHRGPLDAHRRLLDRALLAAEAEGDSDLRSQVHLARARCAYGLGDVRQLESEGHAALRLAKRPRTRARVLSWMGFENMTRTLVEQARERMTEAEGIFTELGDDRDLAVLLGRRAMFEQGCGNLAVAAAASERCLALFDRVGRRHAACMDLGRAALVAIEQGNLDRARALCERALRDSRETFNRRSEMWCNGFFAHVEHERGETLRARRHAETARDLAIEAGERRARGLFEGHLAVLDLEDELREPALSHFGRMRVSAADAGDTLLQVFAYLGEAIALAIQGDRTTARATVEAAHRVQTLVPRPWLPGALDAFGGLLGLYSPDELAARRAERGEALPIPITALSLEVRFALRLIRRALAKHAQQLARLGMDPQQASQSLVLGPGLAWVRTPTGERVQLQRRPVLQRLLAFFIEQQGKAPASIEAVVSAVWPGDPLSKQTFSRARVAIFTLRRLGLQQVLLTHGDRYGLDDTLRIVHARAEDAAPIDADPATSSSVGGPDTNSG